LQEFRIWVKDHTGQFKGYIEGDHPAK